jgi:hypothetical protein
MDGVSRIPGALIDVNHDGRIDALDFQSILSGILLPHPTLDLTGVNGDGPVSILDLQAALAGIKESRPVRPPLDSRTGKSWGPPAPALVLFKPDHGEIGSALPVSPKPAKPEFDLPPRGLMRLETARYLFHCTPNAPPSFA